MQAILKTIELWYGVVEMKF